MCRDDDRGVAMKVRGVVSWWTTRVVDAGGFCKSIASKAVAAGRAFLSFAGHVFLT